MTKRRYTWVGCAWRVRTRRVSRWSAARRAMLALARAVGVRS